MSSFWEYFSPTSNNTNELNASFSRSSRSTRNDAHNVDIVVDERTGLLDGNRSTKNRTSTFGSGSINNDVIYESPQLVQNSLDQLRRELRIIIDTNNSGSGSASTAAYHKACQQSYEYVQSLRMSFLRAECFNASKASLRMISFWEEKERLFGDGGCSSSFDDNSNNNNILGRPIRLSDLSADDLTALRSGALQLLMPQPQQQHQNQQQTNNNDHNTNRTTSLDSRNRGVLCYFPKYNVSKTPDNMTRAWWYYVQCLLFDDDGDKSEGGVHHQKHGFVVITYHVGDISISEMDRSMNLNCLKQLPIRFSGKIHYCFNDYKIRQALSLYKIYATTGRSYWYSNGDSGGDGNNNDDEEESWYLHDGSLIECKYRLRAQYGIPSDDLPLTIDGELIISQHIEWINRRKKLESST